MGVMRIFQHNNASATAPMDNTLLWPLVEGGVISGQVPSKQTGSSMNILPDVCGKIENDFSFFIFVYFFLTNTSLFILLSD